MFSSNHSLVIEGYDEEAGVFYLADSISGDVTRSISYVYTMYLAMGAQAVILG